jgi:hypothetical protein
LEKQAEVFHDEHLEGLLVFAWNTRNPEMVLLDERNDKDATGTRELIPWDVANPQRLNWSASRLARPSDENVASSLLSRVAVLDVRRSLAGNRSMVLDPRCVVGVIGIVHR